MTLSIITINRNNAIGLEKTMQSVLDQDNVDFEYVVVDGASTDGSVGIIRKYESAFGARLKWISEPDKGIYNAMNKGIKMSSGVYLEFLNSGDCLMSSEVVDKMCGALEENCHPSILYGNMLKVFPNGKLLRDRSFAGEDITLLGFFRGTLNHSSSFIGRSLFARYGLYDESLKIVSDWEWFFQAIILGEEKPVYTDIDVTLFDMSGISETNKVLGLEERERILSQLIPKTILSDYQQWTIPITRVKRLMRYPLAFKAVHYLERFLFKWEKSKLEYVR